MTVSFGASTAKAGEFSTFRGVLVRHKLASLGLAGIIAVMLATTVVTVFGAKAGAVTDSTSCTQWGSANQVRQAAYARLYVREHGALPGGGTSPSKVIAAINDGCTQAYGEDVSDSTTVTQAISGKF